MRELRGPLARILIRYVVGLGVGAGWLSRQTGNEIVGDPDLVLIVGALIAVGVEGLYILAKRRGWAT